MFRLFSGQKSKAGEKLYIPEDRASDALQNLLYQYSSKFGRSSLLREKVCVVVNSRVLPIKSQFTKGNYLILIWLDRAEHKLSEYI